MSSLINVFNSAAFIFNQLDNSSIAHASEAQKAKAFVNLFENAFKHLTRNQDLLLIQPDNKILLVGERMKLVYPQGLVRIDGSSDQEHGDRVPSKQTKQMSKAEFTKELARINQYTSKLIFTPNSAFETPRQGDAILDGIIKLEKQYDHHRIDRFIEFLRDAVNTIAKNTTAPNELLNLNTVLPLLTKDQIANGRISVTNAISRYDDIGFDILICDKHYQTDINFTINYLGSTITNHANGHTSKINSYNKEFMHIDIDLYLKNEAIKNHPQLDSVEPGTRWQTWETSLRFIYGHGFSLNNKTLDKFETTPKKFMYASLLEYPSKEPLFELFSPEVKSGNKYKMAMAFYELSRAVDDKCLTESEISNLIELMSKKNIDFEEINTQTKLPEGAIMQRKCNTTIEAFKETEVYALYLANKMNLALENLLESDHTIHPIEEMEANLTLTL